MPSKKHSFHALSYINQCKTRDQAKTKKISAKQWDVTRQSRRSTCDLRMEDCETTATRRTLAVAMGLQAKDFTWLSMPICLLFNAVGISYFYCYELFTLHSNYVLSVSIPKLISILSLHLHGIPVKRHSTPLLKSSNHTGVPEKIYTLTCITVSLNTYNYKPCIN